MADVHGCAAGLGVPTYLETGTRSNIDFYRSLGYRVEGEIEVPDGIRMWRMERPAGVAVPAGAAASAADRRGD